MLCGDYSLGGIRLIANLVMCLIIKNYAQTEIEFLPGELYMYI